MAPKVQKAKVKASAPRLLKRPSAAVIQDVEKSQDQLHVEFISRCNEYTFSELELDTFFCYCGFCGRHIFRYF